VAISQPGGPDRRSGPARGTAGTAPPVLDLAFDSGTLSLLRAEVQARADQAGFPAARATDVVLALHELAANAVRHGAGTGRLRIWRRAGAWLCQVEDGDPLPSGDPAATSDTPGLAVMSVWQAVPGHGLWVVRQVADQLQVRSGPDGTRATATFGLPAGPAGHASP
jgi:anti-sigma regulatory factor (Ser/Thr protein kinase)